MRGIYYALIMALFLVTLPLQVAIALLVYVRSGWPVLFRQRRTGRDGKAFVLYKFRTMVPGADTKQTKLRTLNEATGAVFKIRNDPRYTPIGKFLSHTGLDELPQLYNILRGDMVFFGPRPLPVYEARKLKPWMRKREQVLPGIISPAILTGTYHRDFVAWMKSDVSYAQNKSVSKDIGLFFQLILFLASLFWKEWKKADS